MSVTLRVSSDIVGGVLGILLAAASYTISSFAYPRLMGRSASDAVESGKTIEASIRSINSIRNWLGFWTISLSALAHFLAFCLEFGILGFSESLTVEKPAVILGGGRRFSNNVTADGGIFSSLFMDNSRNLPDLFTAAVGACVSLEISEEFKMIKNAYPGIDVSQNATGRYVSEFEEFECTSSWLGSAEWTVEPSGHMTVDLETLAEQYRYEGGVTWTYESVGSAMDYAEIVSISYGLGTSFRGESLPVVVVNYSRTPSDFLGAGISISKESGHYVYSLSDSLNYSSVGGAEVLNGTYLQGHYRSSEYSLAGVICLLMIKHTANTGDSLSGMYKVSDVWWESETVDGDYLVHSNPEGSEQEWPDFADASGTPYMYYVKGAEPVQFPFYDGEREATLVSSWCLVLAIILALVVVALTVASLVLAKNAGGFWTYDGLSRMVSSWDNPKSLAVIGVVGGEGSRRIGLVRSED